MKLFVPAGTILTPGDRMWRGSVTAVGCCGAQLGSQFRSKAEPAGHTEGDTWVPGNNVTHTLQGTPRGPYCRDLDEPPPEAKA